MYIVLLYIQDEIISLIGVFEFYDNISNIFYFFPERQTKLIFYSLSLKTIV